MKMMSMMMKIMMLQRFFVSVFGTAQGWSMGDRAQAGRRWVRGRGRPRSGISPNRHLTGKNKIGTSPQV
jgi:hypothetical protein